MTNTLVDISNKLDQPTVELYRAVDQVTRSMECDYLVVGASARDIVLHHGYGFKIERATNDVDFGVQVESWDQFHRLRDELRKLGFKETGKLHRLISPGSIPLDIVPFGPIADSNAEIGWPPNRDTVMNVLGFGDALSDVIYVVIAINPELSVPVVSSRGLALLKLISWSDRPSDLRRKDAQDLFQLACRYERILGEKIFGFEDIMELFGYDVTLAGAFLLGQGARSISVQKTKDYVVSFLDGELRGLDIEILVSESLNSPSSPRASNEGTLKAFADGYRNSNQ